MLLHAGTAARQLRRFLRERGGNVAIMGAIVMPVLLGAAAFAVDEGSLFFERRQAQAHTDLAAITAAANIDKAEEAALLAMSDNGRSGVAVIGSEELRQPSENLEWPSEALLAKEVMAVEKGVYTPDPEVTPAERFRSGGNPENAVRITFRQKGTLYFAGRFIDQPSIITSAVAAARAEAAFSVGSRLASVNDGLLNTMLGALIGSEISLKAMDYRSLLDTKVDVFRFLGALSAELDMTAGTYDDVLATEATIGQVLTAASAAIDSSQVARIALLKLADSASRSRGLQIPLSHVLDLGSLGQLAIGHPAPGLEANLGVMELIGASAAIANRTNQIQVATGINLPGILNISLDLAIGEPPQHRPIFAIGEAGETVRTTQTRLLLEVDIGAGGALGSVIRLPIYLELAYAEARLQSVSCSAGKPSRAALRAQPGVVEAWIGEIDPGRLHRFDKKPSVRPADLVKLPAIKVKGSAHAMAGNTSPTTVTFDKRDIEAGTVKTVSTRDLTRPLVQTLLRDLDLEVSIAGLSLGLVSVPLIENQLANILGAVAGPIDGIIHHLLMTLGVRVGEADLRVTGISCHRAVLVN